MGQPERIIVEMDRAIQIPGGLCPSARRAIARVPFSARILSDLPGRAGKFAPAEPPWSCNSRNIEKSSGEKT